MLQPKQTKFRKMHKGRNRGLAQSGNTVAFGKYGLKASTRGRITARQIEAARRAMTRYIKRGGNIWIRIFPDKPITKKPLETRMGKGKGNVEYWAQYSTLPFPLPIRVSRGFLVIGLSGKILIQIFPPRLI